MRISWIRKILSINKRNDILYYILILYDLKKLGWKIKKCLINRFYNFKKGFTRLYIRLYIE